MGGHGGLNILPQKRWNVYNFDNREKVRQDEEAAAKEEQLKREQARKRDAEFRLEKLRQVRGLVSSSSTSSNHAAIPSAISESKTDSEPKSNHINLFEGIRIFDPVSGGTEAEDDKRGPNKKMKMMKKETVPKVVMPEDEKYRLGYGIAGKGVKLPWYMAKPSDNANVENGGNDDSDDGDKYRLKEEGDKSNGKKTLEELREERLKREKREKERERALILEKTHKREKREKERKRALILEKGRKDGGALKDRGYSRR